MTQYRRNLLMEIVEAYLPLHGPHLNEYRTLLLTEGFTMARVLGKTSREEGIEEGYKMARELAKTSREEGFGEGEEIGLLKGRRAMLRELLEAKFGGLAPEVVARLEAMPLEELRRLTPLVWKADSLAGLGLTGQVNGAHPAT
jgi:hypothetical protein